jgi:lipopolysaccharide/colanic/teichoic acid biosynthesis glycosyltransferase
MGSTVIEVRYGTINGNGQRLANCFKMRYANYKSIIDRLVALVGLLILSPIFTIIALCVMTESRGGVVFRQERIGKNGRKFTMYKFRSMHGATSDDEYRKILQELIKSDMPHMTYKLKFQPRVTRVGALLRRSYFDELPQLFNVLKGDISLVGPRPDLPYSVEVYDDWMKERLLVKPGMTGLWQVSGGNHLSFQEMVKLDIDYIKKQSLWTDAKILFLTLRTVLGRNGKTPKEEEAQNG